MSWTSVGRSYLRCFAYARRESRLGLKKVFAAVPRHKAGVLAPADGIGDAAVPPRLLGRAYGSFIDLSHLESLTNDTGIVQHATWSAPNLDHGYCTDDNARGLLLSLQLQGDREHFLAGKRLGSLYLTFLGRAFNRELGKFRNFMSGSGKWLDEAGSEDSQGRALWALGVTASCADDAAWRDFAVRLFRDAVPGVQGWQSPRAWAFALLGMAEYAKTHPNDVEVERSALELAKRLNDCLSASRAPGWEWFESCLAYDNARLPMALLVAGMSWKRAEWLDAGLATIAWLADVQSDRAGTFLPIGSEGFYPRGGTRAVYDQQPLEAWASFEAYEVAHQVTQDSAWLRRARSAADWFLGRNSAGLAMIDPRTGGCFDGLQPAGVNLNQGAESTLALLSTMARADGVLGSFIEVRSGR